MSTDKDMAVAGMDEEAILFKVKAAMTSSGRLSVELNVNKNLADLPPDMAGLITGMALTDITCGIAEACAQKQGDAQAFARAVGLALEKELEKRIRTLECARSCGNA